MPEPAHGPSMSMPPQADPPPSEPTGLAAPSKQRWRTPVALSLPLVAALIQGAAWPLIQPFVWFLFFPSVFFAALLGGLRCGLASTLISALLAWFGFLRFQPMTRNPLWTLGGFVLVGFVSSVLLHLIQRALDASRRHFDLAFHQSAVGMAVLDVQGRWKAMNRPLRHLLALPEGALPVLPLEAYLAPEYRALVTSALERLDQEGSGTWSEEVHLQPQGGKSSWIQLTLSTPCLDLHRGLLVAVAVDISARRTAEAHLAEERELMKQAQRLGHVGSWCWDFHRDVPLWSEEMFRIFGLPSDHPPVAFETVEQLFTPETWPMLAAAVERTMRTGRPYEQEVDVLRPDGSIRKAISRGEAVYAPDGAIASLRGMLQDVTEQVQAREALRESEERYRNIFENSHTIMFILDPENGRIRDANPAAAAFYGWSRQTLCSMSIQDINMAPAAQVREGMQQVLQGTRRAFLFQHQRADGSVRDVEVFAGIMPMGAHPLLFSIVHDITLRRVADEALRASEQRFSTVFLASPVPILLTRLKDQAIVDANPAFLALSGRELEDLLGRTTADLGFWTRAEERQQALEHLQATGALRNFEMGFQRADGTGGLAVLSSEVVQLGDEPVMVDLFRDVTEMRESQERERRMERELDHLQRLESVGRLAGGISHDMNNVLNAIMAMTSVVQAHYPQDRDLNHKLDVIQQAAARGRDLVKGLTDFARKEVSGAEPLDLNTLVAQEAALLEHTTFKRIQIQLDLEEALPLIQGEASALSNVLMNLCVNACDAMPRGGTLRLKTRSPRPDRVEMIVEDTGEGMPPDVVARAMEPFFTTKPAGKGTGLGLSIVFGTVKAHGGSVEIHSTPGLGTRVVAAFPSLASHLALPDDAPALPSSAATPQRVLVVDDDELVRTTLACLLEVLGHRVESASSGLESLRRFEAGLQVDWVILDLNMPGLSGTDVLSRLRILRPSLPVILSSGHRDAATTERIEGIPSVHFLDKPFRLEDLERLIGRAEP